jgi:hypothetical protein
MANQVVVQFEGICVHFLQANHPQLPVPHRVVLLNASKILDVWGHPIAPHIAQYAFDVATPFSLDGVTLSIDKPLGSGMQYDPTFDSVPNLTELASRLPPGLGPASLALLIGENPDLVSGYFDFTAGTVSAIVGNGGAVYAQVTVETDADPHLLVTPFRTRLNSRPQLKTTPQAIPNGTVFVSNEETGPSIGAEHDFLLSYLTAAFIPIDEPPIGAFPAPEVLQPHTSRKLVMNLLEDPGCSNSQYP